MKSLRNISWPNAFSVLTVALLLVSYFSVFADLDWSWQVRTGEVIVQTGSLRVTDSFSYTIHGTPLPDFEWLYEVLLFWTWNAFGFGGLKFLKLLLVCTPLLIVALRLRAEKVAWHGIALSLLAAVFVLTPAWNLRPLFVTTIGLLLTSWWLHDHCTGRRPLTWWLIPTMLLWANMHPGVITGQGLLLGAIGWECINRWWKWNPVLDNAALKRLILIGGLGFLATFGCPDPIERLRYTFKPELSHPIMRIFGEMRPLHTFLSTPPYSVFLVYVVAGLSLVTVYARFRHFRGWEIALLGGTAVLGNYAYRGTMDWLLVMLAVAMPHMKEMLAAAVRWNRRRAWVIRGVKADRWCKRLFNAPLFRFQPLWPILAATGLLAVSLTPPVVRDIPKQVGSEWPTGALDHIERAGLTGRFFGPPDYGAFVGWRLRERGLCYTDTRGFFFPPLLLEDSHYVPQLGPDWRNRLDRVLHDYGTEFFLLETTGPRNKLWTLLQPHIEPLYVDGQSVLLSAAQVRLGLAGEKVAAGK